MMDMRIVSSTEAKNRFGRVLLELSRTDEPIVVQRRGQPVAVILSIGRYEQLLSTGRSQAFQSSPAEGAFGFWANRDDLDEAWLAESRSRWRSRWPDE